MKELKELVALTESGRINKIEGVHGIDKDKERLTFLLYQGVLDGKYKTDDEARRALYGERAGGVKFDMLKKRLKERLQMGVLFLRTEDTPAASILHNYYYCSKNLAIAKLLIYSEARKAGHELLNKVLSRAQKYELFDIVMDTALMLRLGSLTQWNPSDFNKFNKIFHKAHALVSAESEAEEIYYSSIIQFSKSLAIKPEFIQQVKRGTERIRILKEEHNTSQLNFYLTCMEVMYYQFVGEYDKVTTSCEAFETYMNCNARFSFPKRLGTIRMMKLENFLILRNFEEGKKCAEECLQDFRAGTTNWYVLMDLYFLLSLNTGNYEKATEIYSEAVSHPDFNNLQQNQQEIWRIYSGYLWFLLTYEKNTALRDKVFHGKTTFSISKLLNDIPVFSQDKKGLNIAILILQILILLQERKYEQIISRTDSLKNYLFKNLKQSDNIRSQLFIKLLIALERSDFSVTKKDSKIKKLADALAGSETTLNAHQSRIEIIPYQRLWQITADMLQNNGVRKSS